MKKAGGAFVGRRRGRKKTPCFSDRQMLVNFWIVDRVSVVFAIAAILLSSIRLYAAKPQKLSLLQKKLHDAARVAKGKIF